RCRAAVVGSDGRLCPAAEGPGLPAGAGLRSVEAIVEALTSTVASAVVAAAAARHEVGQVEMISAGLAGLLGTRDVAPAVAARLHERLGATRVSLCGDVVAAHAGALPDPEGGVVVVAGTGAVAFGAVPVKVPEEDGTATEGLWSSPREMAVTGREAGGDGRSGWVVDSAVACVDGWGHLLGDAGSGFWIGRRGLDAALRAHDGRTGGSPLLARLVERDIGPLDHLPQLAARAGAGPVAAIASFSVQVAEAAAAGDDVARYIWLEAASALADSAVACAQRLNPGSQIPIAVSWMGGLFSVPDSLLLEPFLARMRSTFPAADLVPPAADALAGAARLATPGARGALAGLVFDSSGSRRAPVTA
ncbi:MAG TPA: BadF/BadG/BcrA/BcrD ATPase family protein, partial [Acidimicrobiia bacterium]|nr:BadF/BadG/BcrA/BcrD ATPase family protein [Acidimicrobiia bacterium]